MMSFGQQRGYGSQGGFGRSFGSFKKPVEVGQEYSVTISDTSRRGDGIAKVDGFVVFVPATKLGQDVRIKVTQVSDRYATAEVIDGQATATFDYTENVSRR
jgi:predicted RNA-binding protein with TRAM domain